MNPSYSRHNSIDIEGARVHNLKNISVSIPHNSITVLTGPSGSGKSSLAFDTIYAEGQRRYIESLSTYARQFLEQFEKPDVERISGLSPTIAIEQGSTGFNPRSTVGTVTEVYDYLRLLFSKVSTPTCWSCGRAIQSQTQSQMVNRLLEFGAGTETAIIAPIARAKKGEFQKELRSLRQRGYVRARIDGKMHDLSDDVLLKKNQRHDIDVYIDRLIIPHDKDSIRQRAGESIEAALKLGKGLVVLLPNETLLSSHYSCTNCEVDYPEPEPRTFSFNSALGACPTCEGIGLALQEIELTWDKPCPDCNGARLKKESTHFFIGEKNISVLSQMPIQDLERWISSLDLSDRHTLIATGILAEIKARLGFLIEVGAGYLSLSRSANSLSGGESQRIRLARQIGSQLIDVIYVLDEPSIGLHPRDHGRLLVSLKKLRDAGNTVLVVEHDRETIETADCVLDLGPGAGIKGGNLTAIGTPFEIEQNPKSLTGAYLSGKKSIAAPRVRRKINALSMIRIFGAKKNNLREINAEIPLGVFTCVTGVSGSGKSTLIMDTLYPLLLNHIYGTKIPKIEIDRVSGIENIDKVINIDQSPIGRTPRSNPATYTGMFSPIREIFARLPDAAARGFGAGHFSFNVRGGRCEACEGDGAVKLEMHFLPNVFIKCKTCSGKRYAYETLQVRLKGKSIADILDLTVEEALIFFSSIEPIRSKLEVLGKVGLGYIHLGQSATTLSGGEAQRIKLSRELSKKSTGNTIYILDEPSTGLHFDDIHRLLSIIQMLVDQGNTVIVIEHNIDIIKCADHLIDLGPEGGGGGGKVVAVGPPEEIAEHKDSWTGRYLVNKG